METLICSRILRFSSPKKDRDVVVRIFLPKTFGENKFFECKFEIEGLGSDAHDGDTDNYLEKCVGVDSVQALVSALEAINRVLLPLEESLSWLGSKGEHGFPIVLSYLEDYGITFRRDIKSVIEKEQHDFLARRFGNRIQLLSGKE